MVGVENRTQDYDNEPNDQHQLPREYDGERADGCDANGGEKPTEKPDYPSREQEVKSGKRQKQNDEHFYSPLLNTMVLCVV